MIVEMSGIPVTQRYDTYLGLPTLIGRSKMKTFKSIIDQIWKRLQDWKLKFLSQARKEILLKSAIQAIPTYSMSIFLLLKGLCSEINALMQKFWWSNYSKETGIHWMSWNRIGVPKADGGMGYRDFQSFNKALLAKQGWRLWQMPNSFLSKIMEAKYYLGAIFLMQNWGHNLPMHGGAFLALVIC